MVCVNLSLWQHFKTQSLVSSHYVISWSQHLFSNACWNASFQVKKSVTPVAMTITMGAAQTVLRVPKGTIWTVQLSISHTGAKRHNPHESFPVRHRFNSLFLCDSTNKGRQIKNHLKSICDLMNHYGSFPLSSLWTLIDKLLCRFIFDQISIFFYNFCNNNL